MKGPMAFLICIFSGAATGLCLLLPQIGHPFINLALKAG